MTDAVYMIIDYIHSLFGVLAVTVDGIRIDVLIIFLIIISFFATVWWKGAKG